MKKFIVIILSIISMSICCAYANSSEVTISSQREDCKEVGNVQVQLDYEPYQPLVSAREYNHNNYRVTIKYKIYATNGTITYPIDSVLLDMDGKEGASGPRVKIPDGFSCYLEVENPEYCTY